MLIFKTKNSPKSNFVIWPLFLTENSTWISTYRQESKQNKSEIEEEKRTQLFCAIFFILAFIKHVYQQIWRVSNLFNSILHQIKNEFCFLRLITSDDSDTEDLANADHNILPQAKVNNEEIQMAWNVL